MLLLLNLCWYIYLTLAEWGSSQKHEAVVQAFWPVRDECHEPDSSSHHCSGHGKSYSVPNISTFSGRSPNFPFSVLDPPQYKLCHFYSFLKFFLSEMFPYTLIFFIVYFLTACNYTTERERERVCISLPLALVGIQNQIYETLLHQLTECMRIDQVLFCGDELVLSYHYINDVNQSAFCRIMTYILWYCE